MSDWSYSRTAPKPLQPGQAPRGLLNENRIGVSAGAAVPQFEHVGWDENRRRSPLSSATATPSPSLKAVATASASRPRVASEGCKRSTTTRTSCASRTRCSASGGSSRASTPSSCARTNPAARSCAAASTSGRCALVGNGNVTRIGRGAACCAPTSTRPSTTSCTDRKSTRLNSSHSQISYAVFCLKKKKKNTKKIEVKENKNYTK